MSSYSPLSVSVMLRGRQCSPADPNRRSKTACGHCCPTSTITSMLPANNMTELIESPYSILSPQQGGRLVLAQAIGNVGEKESTQRCPSQALTGSRVSIGHLHDPKVTDKRLDGFRNWYPTSGQLFTVYRSSSSASLHQSLPAGAH